MLHYHGGTSRRTMITKGEISQRLLDLWALRLIAKARLWEDVSTSDFYDGDPLLRYTAFRNLRKELNFAAALCANAEFLETGRPELGRFSLTSGFVRDVSNENTASPFSPTNSEPEAKIEREERLDHALKKTSQESAEDVPSAMRESSPITAASARNIAQPRFVEPQARLPFLRERVYDSIADYDGLVDLFPSASRGNPGTAGEFWKRVSRGGVMKKWLGRTEPESFVHAIEAIEAELKAGEPELSGPFGENTAEICRAFGFTPLDRDIFCFILGGCAENMLAAALTFFDFSQAGTDLIIDVLSVAFEVPTDRIKAAFGPDSALVRSGLIAFADSNDAGFAGRFRFLDSEKFKSLTSTRIPLDRLIASTVVASPKSELSLADYAHLPSIKRLVIPYLREAIVTKRKGANVLLYGLPGTGKTQLARLSADALGLKLYEVSTETRKNGSPRLQRWKTATAFLASAPATVLAIDEAEDVFNDDFEAVGADDNVVLRTNKGEINRLLETNPVPTFWITNRIETIDPAMIRRFDLVIEVPTPNNEARRRIVEKAFDTKLSESAIGRLIETPKLAPAVLSRAADVASMVGFGEGAISEDDVLGMIGETLRAQRFGDVADRASTLPAYYEPAFVNADLDLTALASGLKQAGSGRLCLYGPPGTGKSAYAAWLAKTLGRPLFRRTYADLSSCYVGETEKLIADVFREAKLSRALLLIDEADSFLRDRTLSRQSWETTQVNEMLAQLEAFDGYFVATTNLMDTLDPASMRRFDLKAKFGFLRAAESARLAAKMLQGLGLELGCEAREALARLENLTPGDFSAVRRQAAFRPLANDMDFVRRLSEEAKLKGHCGGRIGFC